MSDGLISPNEAPADRPGARVVLLEDDALARFGQTILLKDWGYQVTAEASLEGVKASLRDGIRCVAAIIADYDLGRELTGADAAFELAKLAGRPIPTLLMSASFGRSSGRAAELRGFEMLAKPVDPEQLRLWLDRATVGAAPKKS